MVDQTDRDEARARRFLKRHDLMRHGNDVLVRRLAALLKRVRYEQRTRDAAIAHTHS